MFKHQIPMMIPAPCAGRWEFGHLNLFEFWCLRFGAWALVLFLGVAPLNAQPLERLTTDGHLKQRPVWSPDGQWLAFTRHEGATIFLFVRSADGKTERRLTSHGNPEFDADWSPDGKRLVLAYDKASPNQGDIDVHMVNLDGTDFKPFAATEGKLSHEEWPSWSPDGQRIAYSSTRDDNQEIYVARSDGSEKKRLTTELAIDAHPAWSPDSKQIVFATSRWGDLELAVMNADGSGLARLTESRGIDDYPAWSRDGKRIAFASNRDGNLEIYTIDPDGKNPRNETHHEAIDNFPSWDKDGRLTFVSNRDGGFDIYRLKPGEPADSSTRSVSEGTVPSAVNSQSLEHFEKRIRPVLVEHCYECHSAAAKEVKGGLLVDSREAMRRGGESGPAVVPGSIEKSLIIAALKHETLEMPPMKKLPEAVIADFMKWIELGAPDPRDQPATPEQANELARAAQYEQRKAWWSLAPVSSPTIPEVTRNAWPAGSIDRFILARLEAQSLSPAQRAESVTLARRLSFALTGLPPAPDEVQRLASDPSPDAFERQADRWLASPHFGERWARHWMDVVRYTDTYGYEWDIPAKGAWRYRDYLVRAFNADVSVDQLIREQIAGDLLPSPRINPSEQINESRIGSMFYQMGEKRHGDSSEFDGIHQEMLDNKVDAFSKTFLGLTVACARCHDHKLDAVLQQEYYALAGIFMSSRWVTNTVDLPARHAAVRAELKQIKDKLRPLLAEAWRSDLTALTADSWREKRKALGDKEPPLEDPLAPWWHLLAAADQNMPIAETWTKLAEKYRQQHEERKAKNAGQFAVVADFREGIPQGWSVDGVGLAEVVPPGDFTVALDGDGAVGQILPGGLFTFALSPRLNGAVRTPHLSTVEPGHLSFEVCGGDFAARRAVIDNAFLTEKQQYLNQRHVAWLQCDTYPSQRQRHNYLEFATKTSNPNFPPRVGLGGECSEAQAADPRSWFGITRVVRHQAPFTPADELTRMLRWFEGEPATSLEDAARKYAAACRAAVDEWAEGKPSDDDIKLLNWLLDSGLLTNRRVPPASPQIGGLVDRYRAVERAMPLPWTVNGMADVDPGYDLPLLVRGEYDQFGPSAPRGYLQALGGQSSGFQTPRSGRLELADRIASGDNPLTARVFVNRAWHWLFGTGIVATPSDFGHAGDVPSHPELLDHLASEFISRNWSLKRLVRRIVTSETWRQSGETSAVALAADPANRLVHHFPLRRLEAEAIRDAMLAVSGRLDWAHYGPPIDPHRPSEDSQKRLFSGPLDGLGRRSLYTKITIMEPPKFLALFNQPPPKIPVGARDVTSTPAQALTLLNDPLVSQQAEVWASALVRENHASPQARIEAMFAIALGRPPTADETSRWTAAAADLAQLHNVTPEELLTSVLVWKDVAHALFNTKEFIYIR
jgi:hypothetical protein